MNNPAAYYEAIGARLTKRDEDAVGRQEMRVLAGAMALAGCKTIPEFNEVLNAHRYLQTADIVLNAADAYEAKRGQK